MHTLKHTVQNRLKNKMMIMFLNQYWMKLVKVVNNFCKIKKMRQHKWQKILQNMKLN